MKLKCFKVDELEIKIFDTRENMGVAVAKEVIATILRLLEKKEYVNIIFAAAPSQNEMLKELVESKEISWERINAFQMDEYIGLDQNAPQLFANYLRHNILNHCNLNSFNFLKADHLEEANEECGRYANLLEEFPVDISLMGIGENGHIAFNDPHVADFKDEKMLKVVNLDEKCRIQQVNDGCFANLDQVPKLAMTLTIPALMKAEYVFCTVPTQNKSWAVTQTVEGEINEICPSTVLRKKNRAKLFLDKESGAKLLSNY